MARAISEDTLKIRDMTIEGKTPREIAKATGKKVNAIHMTIGRLRKRGDLPPKEDVPGSAQEPGGTLVSGDGSGGGTRVEERPAPVASVFRGEDALDGAREDLRARYDQLMEREEALKAALGKVQQDRETLEALLDQLNAKHH
jgi:hypothetical protein